MSRSLVTLRDATLADVPLLAELWQPFLRRGSDEQLLDLATAIEQLGDRPGERLVVAEYDGEFAGGVYLRAGTYSPVNPEPVLQAHNAMVVSEHPPSRRRQGADGVRGHLGGGARHRSPRHGHVVGLP